MSEQPVVVGLTRVEATFLRQAISLAMRSGILDEQQRDALNTVSGRIGQAMDMQASERGLTK